MEDTDAITQFYHGVDNGTNLTTLATIPNADVEFCVKFVFIIGIILIITCLFGILGNTISLIVLGQDKGNPAALFLLKSLAVVDTTILILMFALAGLYAGILQKYYAEVLDRARAYIIAYVNPFASITHSLMIWLNVLIAANCYCAICKPLSAKRICTLNKARLSALIVFFIAISFNLPRFFQYKVIPAGGDLQYADYEPTSIGHNTLFGLIYTNITYTLMVFILPLIIISTLSVFMVYTLRRMRQERNHLVSCAQSSSHRDTDNISRVRMVMVMIFIICNMPERIREIIEYGYTGNSRKCSHVLAVLFQICNLLLALNCASNFLIYSFFRKRFRTTLKKMCYQWCCCFSNSTEGSPSCNTKMALLSTRKGNNGTNAHC